jgi:oxygen-independent coproporphyrinogen-3 oxidase
LEDKNIKTIFFGGGTPSLMKPDVVGDIIDYISENYNLSEDVEITLEANPSSVEADKFHSFKLSGINRVSLGIQSLNDQDLKFLGRKHSANDALNAIEKINRYFDNYSFDLIYALPEQSLSQWENELKNALKYISHHLSAYQLIIEKGTAFYTWYQRGVFDMPTEDTSADLYNLTQDILTSHGLEPYEVSNHSLKGYESQHNLIYWRYDDYLGLGPGAHGRVTIDNKKYALRNHKAPETWLKNVKKEGRSAYLPDSLSMTQRLYEMLIMGLRLADGIPLSKFNEEFNKPIEDIIPLEKIILLQEQGLMRFDNERLSTTKDGRLTLNSIIQYLI